VPAAENLDAFEKFALIAAAAEFRIGQKVIVDAVALAGACSCRRPTGRK
jgi:hypothetical protein